MTQFTDRLTLQSDYFRRDGEYGELCDLVIEIDGTDSEIPFHFKATDAYDTAAIPWLSLPADEIHDLITTLLDLVFREPHRTFARIEGTDIRMVKLVAITPSHEPAIVFRDDDEIFFALHPYDLPEFVRYLQEACPV